MDVTNLKDRKENLAVIGLGYVGLPIAVAFSKKVNVIGFDVNKNKIDLYKEGIDPTFEVGNIEIVTSSIDFTYDEKKINTASFIIVAVPTPVKLDHTPDLSPVEAASYIIGRNICQGAIVVFESTVYPGVTEDICVPIIEKTSGLKCGIDFKVGYSPERINPGDKEHRLNNIIKIVSGMDEDSLNKIASVYELVIDAGVYRANSIRVAEAAKVIENSQRDINIAFMNELSKIFNRMNIDTKSVLEAAGTKWNFLKFQPGLVGGHCIGVDPYYLTYRAENLGYHSQIILAGRKINDDMGRYIAEMTIKQLIKAGLKVKDTRVGILGVTFKENCPDVRNTKVVDIVNELKEYDVMPLIYDPVADNKDFNLNYGLKMNSLDEFVNLDAIIIAVAHNVFREWSNKELDGMFRNNKILIDIKGIMDKDFMENNNYYYWRL